MIIYRKSSGSTQITVPAPMNFKLPSYTVTLKNMSTGVEYVNDEAVDTKNLSDFVVFDFPYLVDIPEGEYLVTVNDSYSRTMLRVVEDRDDDAIYGDNIDKVTYYNG